MFLSSIVELQLVGPAWPATVRTAIARECGPAQTTRTYCFARAGVGNQSAISKSRAAPIPSADAPESLNV